MSILFPAAKLSTAAMAGISVGVGGGVSPVDTGSDSCSWDPAIRLQ